jgi:hypothetical protein
MSGPITPALPARESRLRPSSFALPLQAGFNIGAKATHKAMEPSANAPRIMKVAL